MKNFKQPAIYLYIAILSMFFLGSCDLNNTDTPEKPANQYLISSEVAGSITRDQATAIFTTQSPNDAQLIGYLMQSDVEIRKFIYKTTLKTTKIQASGLVCVPTQPGNYPIMSFQNGTNTLHNMAPTEAVNDDLYKIIESISAMGFIVVVPDYIGFGASSELTHPYLHAESTKQSILDLIRAAKEYCSDDKVTAKTTKDLFIFGYSQGGWATMELQKEIETNYSTEFNLKASSCGAGPYSIEYLTSAILSQPEYPTPYFMAYLLNSYNAIGEISNPLSDFFNAPYATTIPSLFDGNHTGGDINSHLTSNLSVLFTSDFRTKFGTDSKFAGLRTALAANSITAWKTTTPTKLFHGTADEVIPYSMSQKMLADFQTAGVPSTQIQLVSLTGATHTSGVFQAGIQTVLWFLTLKTL